jgi:hypothetical protein
MTKDKNRKTPLRASNSERPDQTSQPRSGRPKLERTAAGEQHVLPGAEQISQAEPAKRRAEQHLKPKAKQKPADEGLFSDQSKQIDLVNQLKAAELEKPAGPDEFDKAFEAALDKIFGKKTPGTAAEKQGRQPQLRNEPPPFTKRARSAADKAMSEISKLFGGLEEEEPAQWTIDPCSYAQLQPDLVAAATKIPEAAGDVDGLIQQIVRDFHTNYSWNREIFKKAEPYFRQFITDVKAARITSEQLERPAPEAN